MTLRGGLRRLGDCPGEGITKGEDRWREERGLSSGARGPALYRIPFKGSRETGPGRVGCDQGGEKKTPVFPKLAGHWRFLKTLAEGIGEKEGGRVLFSGSGRKRTHSNHFYS